MFRLLGFDVHVQPGHLMLIVLIVMLNPNEFGLWLAGSLTVLTLVHEVGHALAARRTGAHAEISLGFLAGYASYTPSRALSRLEQAWISFAGPFLHITVSLAVLVAMGINPLDPDSFTDTSASQAIWWAGPAIGLLNLIPVLPLDGGHILAVGLDRLVPGRAARLTLYFSIAATVAATLYMLLSGTRGFVVFIGFLLITQFQMLQAHKPRTLAVSPWISATNALEAGHERKARRTLLAALSYPQPRPTALDIPINLTQAERLIDLLPRPLPFGAPSNEYVLANLLMMTRRYDEAAHYAAGSYERDPNTLSALIVARCGAALGDEATAIGWLRSAAQAATSPAGVVTTIDRAPEFAALRNHPEVAAIRELVSATP